MPVFIAEINGEAILSFGAANAEEAQEWVKGEDFRDDLGAYESDGDPVWDGETDIEVRPATSEEAAEWEESRNEAISEGEIEASDEPNDWLLWLIEIDEDEDEDDEEDAESDKPGQK
jgi:hypothetical protein